MNGMLTEAFNFIHEAMLEFRKNLSSQPSISVLAQPRSILVFQDELYTSYFHGIEERLIDKVSTVV